MTPEEHARRQREANAKQRERGNVQVKLWVPEAAREGLVGLAEDLRTLARIWVTAEVPRITFDA